MKMETRICKACGEEKPITEYYDYRSTGGYLHSKCKKCVSRKNIEHFQARRSKKFADIVKYIEDVDKGCRARAIISLIREYKLNEGQLQQIVRNVEI
jgi:hypothetical protein